MKSQLKNKQIFFHFDFRTLQWVCEYGKNKTTIYYFLAADEQRNTAEPSTWNGFGAIMIRPNQLHNYINSFFLVCAPLAKITGEKWGNRRKKETNGREKWEFYDVHLHWKWKFGQSHLFNGFIKGNIKPTEMAHAISNVLNMQTQTQLYMTLKIQYRLCIKTEKAKC